jgi:flagellar basal-body rod modification protein FlgD
LPTAAGAASASTGKQDLANENTFLTLLVSQLQHQDPLNPADGTTFVTQLAQFTQLEDLQNINQNVIKLTNDVETMMASNSGTTDGSSGTSDTGPFTQSSMPNAV